jgi:hypothetical protein
LLLSLRMEIRLQRFRKNIHDSWTSYWGPFFIKKPISAYGSCLLHIDYFFLQPVRLIINMLIIIAVHIKHNGQNALMTNVSW